MELSFWRTVWLPVMIPVGVLLLALVVLLVATWRSQDRLQPANRHIAFMSAAETVARQLQLVLEDRTLRSDEMVAPATLTTARSALTALEQNSGAVSKGTPGQLREIDRLLPRSRPASVTSVNHALSILDQVQANELQAHARLLSRLKEDSAMEFRISALVLIGFPLIGVLVTFALRHRILAPLNNLRGLMTRLAQQDYSKVPASSVDPVLRPLFENYNHLVSRLAELEEIRTARQKTLEHEVRRATEALLQQQRSLGDAERLAAVGEVAASLAHELRNPLAGILMALGNLRSEMIDTEHAERLDPVISELNRIARLLGELLDQSKQAPEPARELDLKKLTEEFCSLARYQLPEHIVLCNQVPENACCRLPPGGLRQALLNLILNSAEALAEHPGTVTIQARILNGRLQLEVVDDGPGFGEELLRSGIRSFSTSREHGTGLGLAMVRRFARELNGEFHISNLEPHGACARLDLPCLEHTSA